MKAPNISPINPKYLLLLSLSFILFTIIGTVSHEYGHIAVARMLGYTTTLHYGSMNWKQSPLDQEIAAIYYRNETAIENGKDFEEKANYHGKIEKRTLNALLIKMGGPIQTMLTGLIGLTLLLWRRKKIRDSGLKFPDWLAVFLTLFWLREVFNLVTAVGKIVLFPDGRVLRGDEFAVSRMLGLPEWTFPILLGTIGLAISLFVIFRIIPLNLRPTFILSGLIGGISGFYLWMNVVGTVVLP